MTEILTILQCTVIMNERIFPYGILSNVSKELNILEKDDWDLKSYSTRGSLHHNTIHIYFYFVNKDKL